MSDKFPTFEVTGDGITFSINVSSVPGRKRWFVQCPELGTMRQHESRYGALLQIVADIESFMRSDPVDVADIPPAA